MFATAATRTAAAALCVVAVTACNEFSEESTGRASDCLALASDTAESGLESTPTREEAEQAVQRLEERIPNLTDTEIQESAETLRDRLDELSQAAEDADPDAVEQAVEDAREAGRDAAETCNLPVDQFLQ